jgi:putative transposase
VVDCVSHWSARAELPVTQLLLWLGIPSSKYYAWVQRYAQPNAHNALAPKQFWLLPEERQAILDFQEQHPDEGYRRLCFMMLDADVAAVSP